MSNKHTKNSVKRVVEKQKTGRTSISIDSGLLSLAKKWCKANDTDFSIITGELWDRFLRDRKLTYRKARDQ